MRNLIASLLAGLGPITLLLAAPAAQAQSAGVVATGLRPAASETASVRTLDAQAAELAGAAARNPDTATKTRNAGYYHDAPDELRQALAWTQETNALHPEYWSVYAEARMRLQLKDYAGAQAAATEAKKLSLAAANPDYARRSDEVLALAKARTN